MTNTIQIQVWSFGSLYAHSVPHHLDEIEKISDALKCDVTADDLWEFIRHSTEVPHLGNAYCYLLFSSIEASLKYKHPEIEVDYYVNGFDTHLYLNSIEIHSEDNFWDIVMNTVQ